eukprot:s7437_g5.t1
MKTAAADDSDDSEAEIKQTPEKETAKDEKRHKTAETSEDEKRHKTGEKDTKESKEEKRRQDGEKKEKKEKKASKDREASDEETEEDEEQGRLASAEKKALAVPNSSSHRKEYMRFKRWTKSKKRFPAKLLSTVQTQDVRCFMYQTVDM